jgi:hypothetical protein
MACSGLGDCSCGCTHWTIDGDIGLPGACGAPPASTCYVLATGEYDPNISACDPSPKSTDCHCCIEFTASGACNGSDIVVRIEVTSCIIQATATIGSAIYVGAQTPYHAINNPDGFTCDVTTNALQVALTMVNTLDSSLTFTLTLGSCVSDCPNNWPKMIVSVYDADYAGGNITWCGQVWTPAEVQAGAAKVVCPTNYTAPYKSKSTPFPGAYQYFARHTWLWLTGISTTSLHLDRDYFKYSIGGGCVVQSVRNSVDLRGQDGGAFSFKFRGGCAVFYTSFGGLTGADVTGYPMPTYNAYKIPLGVGDFFGSHTIGGVLYTWRRGVGWP